MKKISSIRVGIYCTLDGRHVNIDRIDGLRAFGRFIASTDSTWWYVDTGQHGLYPEDDLIRKVITASTQ